MYSKSIGSRSAGRRRVSGTLAWMSVVLVLGVALTGVVYGLVSNTLSVEGLVDLGFVNAGFTAASTDDPPGAIDPGYDKDVADCVVTGVSDDLVEVVLTNAYPSYTCTFTTTIENGGSLPERLEGVEIDAPAVLTVTELTDLTGIVLDPGEGEVEEFSAHVEQEAAQGATYTFTVLKGFSQFARITVHKVIDEDGDPGTTDDQTLSGSEVADWTFTPSVTGGTPDPASDKTDSSGAVVFDVSIDDGTATVSITESLQSGYDLVAASCAGATDNGSFDSTDSVEGIAIGQQQDIISCTFYNSPQPAPTPSPTPTVAGETQDPLQEPAALPDTGGGPPGGAAGAVLWLAAILGAIAVMAGGGFRLVTRLGGRAERNPSPTSTKVDS